MKSERCGNALKLGYVGGFQAFVGLGDFKFDAIAFVESFEAIATD